MIKKTKRFILIVITEIISLCTFLIGVSNATLSKDDEKDVTSTEKNIHFKTKKVKLFSSPTDERLFESFFEKDETNDTKH